MHLTFITTKNWFYIEFQIDTVFRLTRDEFTLVDLSVSEGADLAGLLQCFSAKGVTTSQWREFVVM